MHKLLTEILAAELLLFSQSHISNIAAELVGEMWRDSEGGRE